MLGTALEVMGHKLRDNRKRSHLLPHSSGPGNQLMPFETREKHSPSLKKGIPKRRFAKIQGTWG